MQSNVIVSVTISRGSFVFPCLLLGLSLSLTLVSKCRKYVTLVRKYVTTLTEPDNRQGAVYKIKCTDCQASYILVRLAATLTRDSLNTNEPWEMVMLIYRNAVHHQVKNHNIDWDSAQRLTYF